MALPERCVAVIPCHNEVGHIAAVISGIREHLHNVWVVNDASTDGTAETARRAGAEVLDQPGRRGKGAALRWGWQEARRRGFEWALCMDGDGQHLASDIPQFFTTAQRSGADLVVGNRFATSQRMPLVRRVTNRGMSRLLGRVAGRSLPDTQCGFRLVRLSRVAELRLVSECFEIESELILAAVRGGWKVEFTPVSSVYAEEKSKIRPVRDGIRWLRWFVRTVFARNGYARSAGRNAESTIRQPN